MNVQVIDGMEEYRHLQPTPKSPIKEHAPSHHIASVAKTEFVQQDPGMVYRRESASEFHDILNTTGVPTRSWTSELECNYRPVNKNLFTQ